MGERPRSFGDRALRFALPPEADRAALLDALRAIEDVHDVVLTETMGAVFYGADARAVLARVTETLAAPRTPAREPRGRTHVVPVVYDGADLDAVAQAIGASREDVVARHTGVEMVVAMMGFVPGFAYLRGLDAKLHVPRRSPRTRVPKGSVAIAAGYGAIYPFASPGGWNLLGRATFAPFDARGATFALGDRVRFVPAEAIAEAAAPLEAASPAVGLRVIALTGPALVVDGGRLGHAHEGVPASGPLVPAAMAAANRAAGNPDGACALEIYGAITARADVPITLADRHGARTLAKGTTHVVERDPSERVTYLAVGGGFDVPVVLGSRTTLLVAGLGGHRGRWLARGDVLAIGAQAEGPTATTHEHDDDDTIHLLPGPDALEGALATITTATFRITPSSDRTGTRLEGPALPVDLDPVRPSTPMVRGAIQLTPSGLVVLGPDHPTTGGYPVVAIVAERSMNRLFSRPLGARVRFDT